MGEGRCSFLLCGRREDSRALDYPGNDASSIKMAALGTDQRQIERRLRAHKGRLTTSAGEGAVRMAASSDFWTVRISEAQESRQADWDALWCLKGSSSRSLEGLVKGVHHGDGHFDPVPGSAVAQRLPETVFRNLVVGRRQLSP